MRWRIVIIKCLIISTIMLSLVVMHIIFWLFYPLTFFGSLWPYLLTFSRCWTKPLRGDCSHFTIYILGMIHISWYTHQCYSLCCCLSVSSREPELVNFRPTNTRDWSLMRINWCEISCNCEYLNEINLPSALNKVFNFKFWQCYQVGW